MNITPFVFWAFLSVVGFLLGGPTCALIGLATGLGITLFLTLFPR